MVLVALQDRIQAVLDLESVLANTRISRSALMNCDWSAEQNESREALTQCIGRLAWEAKLEALLVPSSLGSSGTNLVLFPGRRRRGSSWKIQGVRDLPPKRR